MADSRRSIAGYTLVPGSHTDGRRGGEAGGRSRHRRRVRSREGHCQLCRKGSKRGPGLKCRSPFARLTTRGWGAIGQGLRVGAGGWQGTRGLKTRGQLADSRSGSDKKGEVLSGGCSSVAGDLDGKLLH